MLLLALLPFWEAWAALSEGSLANRHCNGLFARELCDLGSLFGIFIWGPGREHIGYAAISGALGLLVLVSGLRTYFTRLK